MAWGILGAHYFGIWQEGMATLRQHKRRHGCKEARCEERRDLMARNSARRWLVWLYSALSEARR